MYKEIIEKYYLLFAVILFLLSYALWYPQLWMITDAMSYSTQALAFAQKQLSLFYYDFLLEENVPQKISPYNLGTACFHSVFVFLFGSKGIFLSPLFCLIGSLILNHKTLKNLAFSRTSIALLVVSPAILFYSRSLMSCMPSLLMVSLFLFVLSKKTKKSISYFILGFILSFSIWFRETNSLILLPFIFSVIITNRSKIYPIILGVIVGLSPKIISTKIVFGSWWFSSASDGFQLINISNHALVYLIILLVIFPLSLLPLPFYNDKWKYSIWISVTVFLLIYLTYNYTAVEYSGLIKGSLLTSRFIIPLLPVLIIAMGNLLTNRPKWDEFLIKFALPLSLLVIPIGHYQVHKMYTPHEKAAKQLFQDFGHESIVYDQSGYTNIIRYINPLIGDYAKASDINLLSQVEFRNKIQHISEPIYAIISVSQGNADKEKRTQQIKNHLPSKVDVPLKTYKIDANNQLEVYQIN